MWLWLWSDVFSLRGVVTVTFRVSSLFVVTNCYSKIESVIINCSSAWWASSKSTHPAKPASKVTNLLTSGVRSNWIGVIDYLTEGLFYTWRVPGTNWSGGWVIPEPVWTTWRRQNSWPYQDSNSDPSVVQPVASRYTDWAITAPLLNGAVNVNVIRKHSQRLKLYVYNFRKHVVPLFFGMFFICCNVWGDELPWGRIQI
jgi:hypothetical protein